MKLYAERNIIDLGEYYTKHISAMTEEKLHSKSDIAAELAFRDAEIDRLRNKLIEECINFQKTVSQFPTSRDCASYNKALLDFADWMRGMR